MENLVDLIIEVYKYHGAGGGCHIVTDDYNTDDESIKWCLENLETYEHSSPGQIEVERKCLEALLSVSLIERDNAIGEFWENHHPHGR